VTTFCLMHGAWHDPSCWETLVAALAARGHDAVTPELPFHDPSAGYAERARPALEAIAGIDRPIVVGHSLAANYAPLVAAARPDARLVHLCGALVPLRPGFPFPPRHADGTTVWDPQRAVEVMYRRLPAATAAALAQRLHPMARAPDGSPLDAPPDVPTTFIYATYDEFFDPEAERAFAAKLGLEPIEIATGHFPMVEDPERLADVLTAAA